jgi:hypothetical protein
MNRKIVVSLTTIPPRINLLGPVIESLTQQTLKPTTIELNIPKIYRNPKFGDILTASIHPMVDIYRCERDWGPATKLLPTLERYWGQDIAIIHVDDDRIYRHDLIEKLIKLGEENPGRAITAHSVSIKRQLIEAHWRKRAFEYRMLRTLGMGLWNPKRKADERTDQIAEGFGGVLTRPIFFDDRVFEYPEHLSSVDDVWISGCLTATGHAPLRCPSLQPSSKPNIQNYTDAGHLDGLAHNSHFGMNRFQANAACIKFMQAQFGIWCNP